MNKIDNVESNNIIHLSVHTESGGRKLLSLWDTERQARRGGAYVPLALTKEQMNKISAAQLVK